MATRKRSARTPKPTELKRAAAELLAQLPPPDPDDPSRRLKRASVTESLTDSQRWSRFVVRLAAIGFQADPRIHEHYQAMSDSESARLSHAPLRWRRARKRASERQRYAKAQLEIAAAASERLTELLFAMKMGGPLAQRAAMLGYEIGEWSVEGELGIHARAHVADRSHLSDQAKKPNPRREKEAGDHDRWTDLAKKCSLNRANERARWIAKQDGCPERWHTVRDFLARERKKANE